MPLLASVTDLDVPSSGPLAKPGFMQGMPVDMQTSKAMFQRSKQSTTTATAMRHARFYGALRVGVSDWASKAGVHSKPTCLAT